MKTLICAILILASGAANAVNVKVLVNDVQIWTSTFPDAQETRIRAAIAKVVGRDSPLTRVQVVEFLARYLRQTVQQVELREAQTAVPVPAEVDVQ